MSTAETLNELQARILSGFRLLFLKTWEEARWQRELERLSAEIGFEVVVWSSGYGPQPTPPGETTGEDLSDPYSFLRHLPSYPPNRLFLLKDFHSYSQDPQIVRLLRDLLPGLVEDQQPLLFVGPDNSIPLELQKDAIAVDLPLPDVDDMRAELAVVLQECAEDGAQPLQPTTEEEGHLLTAVSGLTSSEAHRALSMVLKGRDAIGDDTYAGLVAEKAG